MKHLTTLLLTLLVLGGCATTPPYRIGQNIEEYGSPICVKQYGSINEVSFSYRITEESMQGIRKNVDNLEWVEDRVAKISEDKLPLDLSNEPILLSHGSHYFSIDTVFKECNSRKVASTGLIDYEVLDLLTIPLYVTLGTVFMAAEVANSTAGQAYIANQEAKNQKAREEAIYKKGKRDGERRARKSIKKEPRLPQP